MDSYVMVGKHVAVVDSGALHRRTVNQLTVEEMVEEEAFECWLEDNPNVRGRKEARLTKAWHLQSWLPNKVFVCNKSGEDIIVYVQRSNAEKTIKTVEVAAAGSLASGSVSARLEFELSMHRLQKGAIKAEQQEQRQQQEQKANTRTEKKQKNVMFAVGGGAKGAYITVMLEKDPTQLFCVEQEVPCGYRLVITKGTFKDTTPTAPAAAAAAAAAPRDGEEKAK